MNCAQKEKKILEATTYQEVKKIIETSGLPSSSQEHARLAYQIKEKQPDLAKGMLESVIADIKLKEAGQSSTDNPIGGGTNKTSDGNSKDSDASFASDDEDNQDVGGSNRADPTKRLDRVTKNGERSDTEIDEPNDQMTGGPKLSEDLMPTIHPDIARQMQPQMNQMPPMGLQNQIKQMQYTVKQEMRPYVKEIKRLSEENDNLKEALKAIDKKFQETMSQRGAMKLEIHENERPKIIRETTIASPHESLEDRRTRIAFLDKNMIS